MKRTITLLVASFLCIGIYSFAGGNGDELWRSKVDHKIFEKLQTNEKTEFVVYMTEQADLSRTKTLQTKIEKGRFVYAKLKENATKSQANLIAELDKLGVNYQSFWVFNGLLIEGSRDLLEKIAKRSDVAQVTENSKMVKPKTTIVNESEIIKSVNGKEWGITKTKADKVWDKGFKGKGVVIGGQDTGYDWTHPAIKKQYRGWDGSTADHNYNWHDAAHSGNGGSCGLDSKVPCDDHGHGTHTVGTMCGLDGSNEIGMAPEAKWMGCRDMASGVGQLSTYLECFEWFLAPTDLDDKNADPDKAPHVINNSWGCPTDEGCNTSNFATLETSVNNLRDAGVVVVVSAGNDGSGCSTINAPAAIFAKSFSVGATSSSDAIASFSSRGPVTVDNSNRMKPEISAPGVDVRSCVPGGGYQQMSGTSMAGPHVAGLVALIISANPSLAGNADKIEEIIKNSAVKLSSSSCGSSGVPNNVFGHGRIDALAAIEEAVKVCNLNPKVVQNGEMLEIEGVANAKSYKWYFEGDEIQGATSETYKPTKSGKYKVEVTDNNDCVAMSEEFEVVISGIDASQFLGDFKMYPNPHTSSFTISFVGRETSSISLQIYDMLGEQVYSISENVNGKFSKTIDTEKFSNGIYTLQIVDGNNKWHRKIVKQ